MNAENTLIGITSWGFGCAQKGYPGIYVDVISLGKWVAEAIKNTYT